MLRLVAYFLAVAVLAFGLSWLADNPGNIVVNWRGWIWETNVFEMAIVLSFLGAVLIVAWTILRSIWQSPAAIGNFFNRRREKRGLEALSSGMIAIGAGDRALATRYAVQARKSLPNEPMTHLLRAQAAQLSGDRSTSRRIFEAMLASPDTEALGLRGLFLEAEREGEKEAARQFASRAVKLNPKLSWPVDALFDIQCRDSDWAGALETLAIARKNGTIEKAVADRRRAVLLTAQAQVAEDNDPERALNLASEAHKLAVDLVPAAAIAGRLLASRGATPKATSVIQKTWRKSPHPDLAVAYAYARLGDSPRDRLERVRQLAALTPNVIESPIAVANAAIEAKDFGAAKEALSPLLEGRLTQRVCTLMARIESEETGNAGAVREWLARAVNAPRDPAWTADGIVSDHWQAVSPVTGALDAFQWRVPVEAAEPRDKELLAQKIEELVALGARPEAMAMAAKDITVAGTSSGPSAGPSGGSVDEVPAAPRPAATRAAEPVEAEVIEVRTQAGKTEAAEPKPPETPAADAKPEVKEAAKPAVPSVEPKPDAASTSDVKAKASTVEAAKPSDVSPAPAPAAPAPAATPASDDAASAPPKTEGAAQAAAKSGAGEAKKASASEPRIFVAPRAPDDPGLDEEEAGTRLRPRAV